jgi:hypothetical protein
MRLLFYAYCVQPQRLLAGSDHVNSLSGFTEQDLKDFSWEEYTITLLQNARAASFLLFDALRS